MNGPVFEQPTAPHEIPVAVLRRILDDLYGGRLCCDDEHAAMVAAGYGWQDRDSELIGLAARICRSDREPMP